MLTTILVVFAFVLCALAAVLWPPTVEPYRLRLFAAGVACAILAWLLGPLLR